MLVLSRRKGEAIVCTINGVEIRIVVTGQQGNRSLLGIEAPDEVKIVREELKPKPAAA